VPTLSRKSTSISSTLLMIVSSRHCKRTVTSGLLVLKCAYSTPHTLCSCENFVISFILFVVIYIYIYETELQFVSQNQRFRMYKQTNKQTNKHTLSFVSLS
jgi:hypothetical protein